MLGIHNAAWKKSPSRNVQLCQYIVNKLSYMYIWVSTSSFCFQSYFWRFFDAVSLPKERRTFFQTNTFLGGRVQILWGKFVGRLLHGGTNKSLINILNLKNLHCWKQIPEPRLFYRIMEGLILDVNSSEAKRFQRLSHVIWGIVILFEKLTPEIGSWIWKTLFSHNASWAGDFMESLSFFNIFSGDLLFMCCTLWLF